VINVLEFEEIDDSDPVEFRRDALRRIEPLTRELVSNHAARMDDLGMSA
jgi:hypothetical protein